MLSCKAALCPLLEQCVPTALHMQRMLRRHAPALILFYGDAPHEGVCSRPTQGTRPLTCPNAEPGLHLSWPNCLRLALHNWTSLWSSPVPALTGTCSELSAPAARVRLHAA